VRDGLDRTITRDILDFETTERHAPGRCRRAFSPQARGQFVDQAGVDWLSRLDDITIEEHAPFRSAPGALLPCCIKSTSSIEPF
jgi:hypothetical protein